MVREGGAGRGGGKEKMIVGGTLWENEGRLMPYGETLYGDGFGARRGFLKKVSEC